MKRQPAFGIFWMSLMAMSSFTQAHANPKTKGVVRTTAQAVGMLMHRQLYDTAAVYLRGRRLMNVAVGSVGGSPDEVRYTRAQLMTSQPLPVGATLQLKQNGRSATITVTASRQLEPGSAALVDVRFVRPASIAPTGIRTGQSTAFVVHRFGKTAGTDKGSPSYRRALVLTAGHGLESSGRIVFPTGDVARVKNVLSRRITDNDYALLEVEFEKPAAIEPLVTGTRSNNARRLFAFGFKDGKPTLARGKGRGEALHVQVRDDQPAAIAGSGGSRAEGAFLQMMPATGDSAGWVRQKYANDPELRAKYHLHRYELSTIRSGAGASGAPTVDTKTGHVLGILAMSSHLTLATTIGDAIAHIERDLDKMPKASAAAVRSWLKGHSTRKRFEEGVSSEAE